MDNVYAIESRMSAHEKLFDRAPFPAIFTPSGDDVARESGHHSGIQLIGMVILFVRTVDLQQRSHSLLMCVIFFVVYQ